MNIFSNLSEDTNYNSKFSFVLSLLIEGQLCCLFVLVLKYLGSFGRPFAFIMELINYY